MVIETNSTTNVITINKGGYNDEVVKMSSLELCELINKFRLEEGGRTEKTHADLLKSIRKEVETLQSLGIFNEGSYSLVKYTDKKGEERTCYMLDKWGIIQMLNKESTLVRYKVTLYIKALENKIKELEKQKLSKDIIHRTKNLGMFIMDSENRTVDIKSTKFKNLTKDIIKEGENLIPIIVRELSNNKYAIVDGHNRFVALLQAKQMGFDVDIRYIINNDYTLEKDIELQSITSRGNWKREEKFERGVKLNIPICVFISQMREEFKEVLSDSLVTKCVLRFLSNRFIMHDNIFYSEDTFYNKLGTKKGVTKLLEMDVTMNDKKKTREFIKKFAEFYKNVDFSVSTEHVQAFATNYEYICLHYNELLNKWNVVLNDRIEGSNKYYDIYKEVKAIDKDTFGLMLVELKKIRLALA